MTAKKAILKALSDHQKGTDRSTPVRPSTLPGFQDAPEKYQQTINALLKDRLIEGVKDSEGRMAISLNAHRDRDVQKVLRPVWAHPVVLGLIGLSASGRRTESHHLEARSEMAVADRSWGLTGGREGGTCARARVARGQ